jgi:hypothetical protein
LKSIYLLVLAVSALLTTACVNQTCEDTRPTPRLNVAFKKYTDATRTRQRSADTLINITRAYATGLEDKPFLSLADKDSLLRSKTVTLNLSPSADATVFHLEGKRADRSPLKLSFTVTYSRQPSFISQACGYEISYNNLAVVEPYTDFDDVLVIVPEINPIRNEVHIQLYFKP